MAAPPETPPEGLLPYPDDGGMALSDDAIDSELALLGLLHEQGVLEIVDIMIADALPEIDSSSTRTCSRAGPNRLRSRLAAARNRLAKALQEHHRDTATRLEG